MGLDVSHDCWSGSYSNFSEWRNTLAELAGYELEVVRYEGIEMSFMSPRIPIEVNEENALGMWANSPEDALIVLFAHSDCDGIIMPGDASDLRERLSELLTEKGKEMDEPTQFYTRRFISGLDLAISEDEIVRFG